MITLDLRLILGSLALFALHAVILATPALAAPIAPSPELRDRVGTAPAIRAVVSPAPRCSVRHTSFGPVLVCAQVQS